MLKMLTKRLLKLMLILLCSGLFIIGTIDLFYGTGFLGILIIGLPLLLLGQLSRAGRESGNKPEGEALLSNIRIQHPP